MLWLLIPAALADPCPDPTTALSEATLAFEDAEVELAQAHVDSALSGLLCMSEPVSRVILQDLYGLDAVVAYSQADEARVASALRRLRVAFPDADPHPMFGPELMEKSDAARARLGAADLPFVFTEGRRAWLNGEPLVRREPVQVVAGEHLVQASTATGFSARWVEVSTPTALSSAADLVVGPAPDWAGASAVTLAPGPAPVPEDLGEGRRHRAGLLVAGMATAAVGGGAIAYGWRREQQFKADLFGAAEYGGCAALDACYADARVDAIQAEAGQVRLAYIAGYALTALGVGLVGTELLILPAPRTGGGQVGVRGSF